MSGLSARTGAWERIAAGERSVAGERSAAQPPANEASTLAPRTSTPSIDLRTRKRSHLAAYLMAYLPGVRKLEVDGISDQRARHAVAASAPPAQLGASDGDDVYAFLSQARVGVGVAIVGHDHAG